MAAKPPPLIDAEKESMHTATDDSSMPDVPQESRLAASNDLEKTPTRPTQPPAKGQSGQLQRATTAQDWTGPDDPDNPINWSLLLKIWHIVVPGMQSFTVSPQLMCANLHPH